MTSEKSEIRNQKSKILWLAIPTLIFIAAVWFDLTPLLRGPDEWRWTLRSIPSPERLLVPIVVLGLYVFISTRWLNRSSNLAKVSGRSDNPSIQPSQGLSAKKFLLFITIAAPIIQLALAFAVSRYPLLEFFGPTVSVQNSGYFTTAIANNDLDQLLSNYTQIMPSLPIHAQSHPPGPIVLQWLGWKFFQAVPPLADSIAMPLRTLQCHNPGLMSLDNSQIASALIGMLIPLIGALAVWPLYAFGKRLVGSRAALIAAALFPIMPLFAMWPTQWDQIYPLLLFTSLYFMHTGLESKSIWRVFLAGLPLSIATFFSVGNAILIVIVGLYGFVFYLANSPSRRLALPLSLLLSFTIGCASIWLAYALIYHVNPIEVISTGSRLAFESTTGNRSYGLWLLWNPIDYATFLGLPIVILLLMNWRKIIRPSKELLPLVVSTFVTFILLNLSGIVRGEVGRLWIYFGPLMLLVVSDKLPAVDRAPRTTHHALLIGLLSLQLISLNSRWLVNDSYLDEPPVYSSAIKDISPINKLNLTFGHQISLVGYNLDFLRGGIRGDTVRSSRLSLLLYWQAVSKPIHAYTVFVHIFDANGKQIGQRDGMPMLNQSITSCWQPGDYVLDSQGADFDYTAPAPYIVEFGLYVLETGERLPLDDGSGTSVKLPVP
jgi:hypothetical protein